MIEPGLELNHPADLVGKILTMRCTHHPLLIIGRVTDTKIIDCDS